MSKDDKNNERISEQSDRDAKNETRTIVSVSFARKQNFIAGKTARTELARITASGDKRNKRKKKKENNNNERDERRAQGVLRRAENEIS